MKEIYEKHQGSIELDQDCAIYGQINGDVTVAGGYHLYLYGQINGILRIADDGIAQVYGQVNGDTHNDGRLVVTGVLTGKLTKGPNAETVIHPGAVAH